MKKSIGNNVVKSLVVILLLCVSLVGCSSKDNAKQTKGTSTETDSATETAEVDSATVEPLKVSFTGIAWGNGAEQNGVMEKAFEEMLNLDMDLTWVPYQDYKERINMMMAAGNITDVTQIYPTNGKTFYPQVAEAIDNELFWDLTPFVIDSGLKDTNIIMSGWSDQLWENCSYKGKLYALPRRAADAVPNAGILVRKDLMEQVGITKEPTTVDELGDFIIAMHEATGLFGLDFSTNDFESTNIKQVAVSYTGIQDWGIDENGDFYYQSCMKEYDDFLLWVKRLYDAGAIDPEFVLGQSENSSFLGGKSCVKMHTWYSWNQSEDLISKKFFDDNVEDTAKVWGMLPVKGTKSYTLSINTGTGYDNPVMISKKVAEEDVSRIINAICRTDEEYIWMLHNGLEDIHYTLNADGEIALPSTEEQSSAKTAGYVGGWNQILLDEDADFIQSKFIKAGSSEEDIERAKEISTLSKQYALDINIKSPVLALQSKTYNEQWINIIQDLNDNKALVVMGKMSIDEWDSYIEKLVASADYQTIIAEYKEAKAIADNAE